MSAIMEMEKMEASWPEWFVASQAEALEEFERTPAPTRKDEAWRFSDLSVLDISEFRMAEPVRDAGRLVEASRPLDDVSARAVFGNNRLLAQEAPALPEGVIFCPLEEAARKHEHLFREFFMAQPVELGSHKYAALHRAHLLTGAFLHVPANTEVVLPIEIFHWVEGEGSLVLPHTLIICGENSRVTVVDSFRSADHRRAMACGVNDLHLAHGASLLYVAIQDWSKKSLAFHLNSTLVGREATSTALTLNFGGAFIRGESLSRLTGEGARSEMFSINPLEGRRQLDQRTLQDHLSPSAASDLLYLNALDEAARSIFAGQIRVETDAHRTDAYQKVRNLMLSNDAEAYSMPGLEILADDVRCTHGATSGEISEDELFYLEARGIPDAVGRRLIINGFFQTLLDRLENKDLAARLAQRVSERLGLPATPTE